MGVVCVVGSSNVDMLVRIERSPKAGETIMGESLGRFAGGKGLNQAVAAARSGASTRFCGMVGNDPDGDFLRSTATDSGLDVGHIGVSAELPTGFAHVAVLPESGNSIIVAAGANSGVSPEAATTATRNANVVLAQLEVPAATVDAAMAAGRAAGATTILNAAPAARAKEADLSNVDLLVVNESEAAELGGVEAILESGPRSVILTLGSQGSMWVDRAGNRIDVSAFPVDAVDTTGAGDAFCGALAAKLSDGLEVADAMRWASAAGAIVATQTGAQTPELTPESLARLVLSR